MNVQITINGETREVAAGTTLAELLAQLNIQPRYCATERNLQLVPRAEQGACVLQPDDRVEIVTLVGGG